MDRDPFLIRKVSILASLCIGLTCFCIAKEAKQWIVPIGGNAYLTSPAAGFQDKVEPSGISRWSDQKSVFSIYFRRPRTNKHLTSIHSFLENFADRNGYQGRMAYYGNQWARDTDGNWHELTKTRFAGDEIAQRRYLLDYAGGGKGEVFFMRNGGFFADAVALGSAFEREPTPAKQPDVEVDAREASNGVLR